MRDIKCCLLLGVMYGLLAFLIAICAITPTLLMCHFHNVLFGLLYFLTVPIIVFSIIGVFAKDV